MKNTLLALALCAVAAIGYVVVEGGADHAASSATPPASSEALVGQRERGGAAVHARAHRPHPKPGAPIQLRYEAPSPIEVGETAMVVLELQSATTSGRMDVVANMPPVGLSTIGVARQVFYYSPAQPVHRWELPIHATRSGNLHFGVYAMEYDANGSPLLGRSFAVPVVVGDKAVNTAAFKAQRAGSPHLTTTPSGRLLIEMPSSPPPQ